MLPKVTNINELQNQILEQSVYCKLLDQINKDFQLTGIDFQFPENTAISVFLNQFIQLINELINSDFELFLNLLYRIDIKEETIKRIIQYTDSTEIDRQISFEILKREWQKVWFRLNY